MDFEKRLEKAIHRGKRTRDSQSRDQAEQAVSEEDWKNRHSQCRLDLSEHIEKCLQGLADHFPGFRYQTLIGEDGWGAKISRDDLAIGAARRSTALYSRFEMVVRPYSSTHIVELAAKGTIQNKEAFNRTHFQMLAEADMDSFCELIDLWVLEYAELFAAKT